MNSLSVVSFQFNFQFLHIQPTCAQAMNKNNQMPHHIVTILWYIICQWYFQIGLLTIFLSHIKLPFLININFSKNFLKHYRLEFTKQILIVKPELIDCNIFLIFQHLISYLQCHFVSLGFLFWIYINVKRTFEPNYRLSKQR